MKSFAPISRRTIRTGGPLRLGSCTMLGAESKCLMPRVSSSHPPTASTFLTHSLPVRRCCFRASARPCFSSCFAESW